jgi:hypothetical protein
MMDHLYLDAAFYLAKAACEQDSNRDENPALVFGALTCSVSFLELCINSLFHEGFTHSSRETRFRKALSGLWNEQFDRLPVLTKFQIALALAHVDGFDIGREPYQSVESLIGLRNLMIHPKRILVDTQKEQERIVKHLRGKFEFKKRKEHHTDFPDSVLTPKCATWALVAVLRFLNEFNQKLPKSARSATLNFRTRLAKAEELQKQTTSTLD